VKGVFFGTKYAVPYLEGDDGPLAIKHFFRFHTGRASVP
jgi:hypothetical protein